VKSCVHAIMIFSKRTYRKNISIVLLSAYILVSVLSLLHYHHIDLNRPNSVTSSADGAVTGSGTFNGKNFICTVHQNFTLLHNTSKIDITYKTPDLQYFDSITVIEKVSYFSLLNYNNIGLRAPPISS
jgi:hypothetical protein